MGMKKIIISIPAGFKSAIVYLFATVFTRGLAIITTPIFTRIMTTDQVGMVNLYSSWYSMITVVSTLALTSGGFSIALREFEKERDQYVSSVLSLTSIVAIGLALVYSFSITFWNDVTGLPTHLMLLLLFGLLVAPARDFWLSRQRFEYRYKLSGTVTVFSAIFASGLAVAAVLYANNIGYSDIASVRLFANYFIIYGVAFIIWLSIFLQGRCFYSSKYWRFSLQLSLPLIGYSIASQILSVSDRMMISKMVGNSAVGIYGTLYTVSSLSLMVWMAINSSFEPYLYQNMENPKSKIKKLSMSMLGMYSLAAILLVYLAPEIVRILATEEYYKGIYIMPPVAGGVYFIAVSNLYSDILVYLKRTKLIMVSSAIAATLNVILNYIMIETYGYMAAAYTTLLSYVVMAVLLSIWANREFKKHITEVDFVYDNKIILAMSIVTLVISLFAISVYDYGIVRYTVAAVFLILTVLYGIYYLKESKNVKKNNN
jgi:O-antigen/teichoic acid export membrane protein